MKTKKSEKSWRKINEYIYSNYKLSLKTLKNAKNYIWVAIILFFSFALIGFLFPVFFQEQIFGIIKELIKQTEGLDTWNMIRFIFINNLKSSFFAIFCGVLFGLIPLSILVINGYFLGFVANKIIASEGVLVLWRLFPHGIFELPAVLISIGFGLRLGMFWFAAKNKSRALLAFITTIFCFLIIFGVTTTLFKFPFLEGFQNNMNNLRGTVLSAVLAIFLISFIFSFFVGLRILSKDDKKLVIKDVLSKLQNGLRVFIFIIIPLLVLAAIIEGILIIVLG